MEKPLQLLQIAWTKNLGDLAFRFNHCILYKCFWIYYVFTFKLTITRPKLKEQMQYCVDHPEEISKLSKVKAQVSEVKGVMMENIEKVTFWGF